MSRKPLGGRAITDAERQARYRSARAGGQQIIRFRRPADHSGRAKRWCATVDELVQLQAEYQVWLTDTTIEVFHAGQRVAAHPRSALKRRHTTTMEHMPSSHRRYLDRALQHLRAQGVTVSDDLLAHVAPLGWEHIALTGDYVWANANPAVSFRQLRKVRFPFQARAA